MNVSQMRRLDFYLGIPVCLLLDLFNKLIRPVISWFFSLGRRQKEVKGILIMKYFGMGSIILSSLMVKALRDKFPQAEINFLTFHNKKDVVDMYNLAGHIITIRTANFYLFFSDTLKAIFTLWRKKVDIAIDLEFFAKFSAIMAYFSGAPTRVGFYLRQVWRGDLLTHQVYYNPYHHVTEVFLALANAVEAQTKNLQPPKPVIEEEDDRFIVELFSREHILAQDKVVCINVNVGEICIERRWSAGNFVRLVDELKKFCTAKIIFTGSEGDLPYTKSLIGRLKTQDNVVNLAGKLTIRQLAALLKRTHLFITSDSGPLHLAASLETPTVSFFGPETPILYGPVGNNHLVFYKNLYCSPCLNVYNVKTAMYGDKRCFEGGNRCMQTITANEVSEEIKERFIKKWQR